jgi:hypothetical protein
MWFLIGAFSPWFSIITPTGNRFFPTISNFTVVAPTILFHPYIFLTKPPSHDFF